ncbi:MAG: sugar phosphate isomerase/epimerase [Bryobacterales bacterium]|nr:sugar phosphate isomerase/epimerase [Bryobacterales bacterium]
MLRRSIFTLPLALPCALAARDAIDWSRISVLTDEVAKSPDDAIAFAKQYGLKWVELRDVPGERGQRRPYMTLTEAELMDHARQLKAAGLKVSFFNTGMLKFSLPGSDPVRRVPETPGQKAARIERDQVRFNTRMEALAKAIQAARVFDVDKVRVFAFSRVEQPTALFPRIAGIINEMASEARRAGVRLLLENEGSCNVATSEEIKGLLDLIPSPAVGINWDPVNELNRQQRPFPEGYAVLPKKRIENVQMKAEALVIGPQFLPWDAIFQALDHDGYRGKVGLETHVFDGTLIEKAHLCMKEIQKLTGHNG